MITVVGFNSAIDRSMDTEVVRLGEVMRVHNVVARPGGKGLHVAMTCGLMGEPVRLVGLIDAPHRAWFERTFDSVGGQFCGVEISSAIRTCVAVRDANGEATEFLEPGPRVGTPEGERLMARVLDEVGSGPVVLTWSLPRGLGHETYRDLIVNLRGRAVACLLDASGENLRLGLEAGPFLVSPNREEAEAVTARAIGDSDDAVGAARRLVELGANAAAVSLGGAGVVASWDGATHHVEAPMQTVVNGVGAGDSLVGGIAVGIARGLEIEPALRLGVACAAAAVRHPEPGVLRRDDVERLRPLIRSRVCGL